jgi:short/branched chain acyl-CoA dehydrogenase
MVASGGSERWSGRNAASSASSTGAISATSLSGIGGSSAAASFFQSGIFQSVVVVHSTIEVMLAIDKHAPPAPLTQLSEEEKMFQASVRRFAQERIAPHVREMDNEGVFRKDLLKEFFALGLMAIDVPEEYGGQGGNFFQSIVAIEELARVDPSASVIVDVQNTLFNNAIVRWASEDQKRRYLPRLAEDTVASYALSEPGSGSDAFALATRAVDAGDHYRLTGRKLWITNAAEAGLFLLFANANPEAGYKGITAFLVEREFPGFQVGKKEDKLGIRASSTCELVLDDCRVPKANVVGEAGKGYKIAIETLNEGRIGIGAQMTGLAQGALDHALAYSKQRKQFGKPISEFQGVQFDLAEMAVQVEASRLMVYNAARLRDAGQPFVTEAAMCKYFASEVAERVASRAVEVLGGVGFTKDYPVEKLYRDAKIGRIYEGTSNMQRLTIAKQLLGNRG